jgi:hypothetical protein
MSLVLSFLLWVDLGFTVKNELRARHWWFTPVILVTWEAEMGRIAVRGQSMQIVCETPHLQNNQSKIVWRCGSGCRPPVLQVWSPGFKPQSYQKKKKNHWQQRMNSAVLKTSWLQSQKGLPTHGTWTVHLSHWNMSSNLPIHHYISSIDWGYVSDSWDDTWNFL